MLLSRISMMLVFYYVKFLWPSATDESYDPSLRWVSNTILKFLITQMFNIIQKLLKSRN